MPKRKSIFDKEEEEEEEEEEKEEEEEEEEDEEEEDDDDDNDDNDNEEEEEDKETDDDDDDDDTEKDEDDYDHLISSSAKRAKPTISSLLPHIVSKEELTGNVKKDMETLKEKWHTIFLLTRALPKTPIFIDFDKLYQKNHNSMKKQYEKDGLDFATITEEEKPIYAETFEAFNERFERIVTQYLQCSNLLEDDSDKSSDSNMEDDDDDDNDENSDEESSYTEPSKNAHKLAGRPW